MCYSALKLMVTIIHIFSILIINYINIVAISKKYISYRFEHWKWFRFTCF